MSVSGGGAVRHGEAELRVRKHWLVILFMVLVSAPGIVFRVGGFDPPAEVGAAVYGLAILGAAFLLSWGAETSELEISQGLALAVIALIGVLPEYAVDFVLAWQAGADPAEAQKGLAVANMTGGNRLLIGVAWVLVFALFAYRTRLKELVVGRARALELTFLAIATLYVLLIPLRSAITLIDSIVLVTLFVLYLYYTSRQEAEHVELVGPAQALGMLDRPARRGAIVVVFIYSAAVIFASAEPFAENLKEIGAQFGISEFFLIQWLAPLASESPEVLVASLLTWRGRASVGMGALISSKVNQWTLLIGTLPLAYMASSGDWGLTLGLPLDGRQREEILLTAAQSAFAIAVFVNLRMGRSEALALFVLFATQLFITNENARIIFAFFYVALCIVLLIVNRRDVPVTLKCAWDIVRGRAGPPGEEPQHAPRAPSPGGGE